MANSENGRNVDMDAGKRRKSDYSGYDHTGDLLWNDGIVPTPEQQRLDKQAWEVERQKAERERQWQFVAQQVGTKYSEKSMEQWEYFGSVEEQSKQREVVSKVSDFSERIRQNVETGRNLVAVGARGSGKDHVLTSLLKTAVLRFGFRARFWNGANLFVAMRECLKPHSDRTEAQFIHWLGEIPILAISDPIPPVGPLTEFQAALLLTVLDARYRSDRPTWLTVNCSSRKEMEERMGGLFVDRLLENAEVLSFDWGSYRIHKRELAAAVDRR